MTILYLEARGAIAVSLSMLMAGAFLVQQRTGNSDWVGSALWPVARASGARVSEKIVLKMKGVVT